MHFEQIAVVNFDQRLGVAHSKRWLKYVLNILVLKRRKGKKSKMQNLEKICSFKFAPEPWPSVLIPEKKNSNSIQ